MRFMNRQNKQETNNHVGHLKLDREKAITIIKLLA